MKSNDGGYHPTVNILTGESDNESGARLIQTDGMAGITTNSLAINKRGSMQDTC